MDHQRLHNEATNTRKHDDTGPFLLSVSDMLPAFLDHLRVEENRSPGTVQRYHSHIQRFLSEVGDSPVTETTTERLAYFKRRLLDAKLSAATMAAILSCLRTFLTYLREVHQLPVYDPSRIRRPKIPKREVAYLTKEEIQAFFKAIPSTTLSGLRDRALIEILYASGMRISEALSLNRNQINWELREAHIIGKGNKPRKVYFTEDALTWLRDYLCCGQGKTDTQLSNPSKFLIFIGTDIPEIRVLPSAVVEHLDVSDNIVARLLTRGVIMVRRPLTF
jgi:site-specific recombinase XerD